MHPETHFAKCDGISIAYQTFGEGPDLVICPGWLTNVEYGWEVPERARFHEELARFARVTIFDKRGTGLSDRNVGAATLEQRMDDLRAVMDASSISEAHVLGVSEGGSMAMLFAATFPERVRSLMLFGAFACRKPQPDYPWAPTAKQRQAFYDTIEHHWHESMDIGIPPGECHGAIIHDKIVVIDPRSSSCTVILGSHNLGFKASYSNDENMLIVTGHRELAMAYAVHVLDVYDHYRFRAIENERKKKGIKGWSGFLDTDDKWQDGYVSGSKGALSRYFSK